MEELLSNFGFKFNLCRYNEVRPTLRIFNALLIASGRAGQLARTFEAGAYTRPLFSST